MYVMAGRIFRSEEASFLQVIEPQFSVIQPVAWSQFLLITN